MARSQSSADRRVCFFLQPIQCMRQRLEALVALWRSFPLPDHGSRRPHSPYPCSAPGRRLFARLCKQAGPSRIPICRANSRGVAALCPVAVAQQRVRHQPAPHPRLASSQALDLDNLKSHHWQIQVRFHCNVQRRRLADAWKHIPAPPSQPPPTPPQGCSAVTGDKLIEGMDWIMGDISSRIYMAE